MWPCESASTCTSMWRGASRNFSTYTAALPNADSASDAARSNALFSSPGSRTTRIPFPPPPPTALSATGKPVCFAIFAAAFASGAGPSLPGMTGTPALIIVARARILSPAAAIDSAVGPMKTSPASSTARAKSAFSLRKP